MLIRSLSIELTNMCYFRCIHCYLKNRIESTYQIIRIDDFKNILKWAKNNEVISIVLTGGDPLIMKNFDEYYMISKKMGFITSILTNGIAIDSKLINLFYNYPPSCLEVSIYGMSETVIYHTTQVNINMNLMKNNIVKLRRRGVHVLCKYVVCEYNKIDLDNFIEWANNQSIEYSIEIANIPIIDRKSHKLLYMRPSSEELASLLKDFPNVIVVRKPKTKLSCTMPSSLSIDSNLNIRGCPVLEWGKEKFILENDWEYYSDKFDSLRLQSVFCPAWEQYESTIEIAKYLQLNSEGELK